MKETSTLAKGLDYALAIFGLLLVLLSFGILQLMYESGLTVFQLLFFGSLMLSTTILVLIRQLDDMIRRLYRLKLDYIAEQIEKKRLARKIKGAEKIRGALLFSASGLLIIFVLGAFQTAYSLPTHSTQIAMSLISTCVLSIFGTVFAGYGFARLLR